ncbi:rSAM-modified peptide [Flavobacterium sp. YO12]|nr:rSAM-modified peptide [Flavobacterium sp. YO12]
MSNLKQKLDDFKGEKLSEKQQKIVKGGGITPSSIDPGKGGLGGTN